MMALFVCNICWRATVGMKKRILKSSHPLDYFFIKTIQSYSLSTSSSSCAKARSKSPQKEDLKVEKKRKKEFRRNSSLHHSGNGNDKLLASCSELSYINTDAITDMKRPSIMPSYLSAISICFKSSHPMSLNQRSDPKIHGI